jgi:hypothetical protein
MAELLQLALDPHPSLKHKDFFAYLQERTDALRGQPFHWATGRAWHVMAKYHEALYGVYPERKLHPAILNERVSLMLLYLGYATYHRDRELDAKFLMNLTAAKELRDDLIGYHPETRHMLELLMSSAGDEIATRSPRVRKQPQHTPRESASGYLLSIMVRNAETKFTDLEIAALVHEQWPGSCYERPNMIVYMRRRLKIGKCKGIAAIDVPQFKEPLR